MIDASDLDGKVVRFNLRDRHGEVKYQSYGRVVDVGRKGVGRGMTKAGRVIKRQTVAAVVVRRSFKSLGIRGYHHDLRVPLADVTAVRVRGRDIPIKEYQGGVEDGRAEDADDVREPRCDSAIGIEP